METVSVGTISESGNLNDCKKIPELSDKQKKSGKKKKRSRKLENEMKNDSHISSQNGNTDGAFSFDEKKEGETEKSTTKDHVSILPAKSCQQDSISCEEPEGTLHHRDPVLSTKEDSLPDANKNGSGRKKSKKREKKKKDDNTSCGEIMLDAEKNTNEDQVHPPNDPLSSNIIQEGSNEHTQDSCEKLVAAPVCTAPNLSTGEDSQSDVTNMTCSQKRKTKKKRDRNTLKESDVDSVIVNSCPKSKDDTVEQQESTDVTLNETVAQTQSPKAKKKKKRKTKTVEICDPLENNLLTSKNGPVECLENTDGNGGQKLISCSASQRENSACGEESGFQNLEKTEEKKTNENTEVKEDVLGAGVCDGMSKKRKGKKKKMSSADHNTADMEVCDPSGSADCLLDHSNGKHLKHCDGNAGQELGGEDMTSKIEKTSAREKSGVQKSGKHKELTKDENIESNLDALGAEGVSDVGHKRRKRKKKNKKTNYESAATMDIDSVQCLLPLSNREGVDNPDGNADGEIASKDLASNIEDSATKEESVQDIQTTKEMRKNRKGEVTQDALGADSVSEPEVKRKKSKKKKKSLDDKVDDEIKEKDKLPLPRNDEEPEVDREKLENETSRSSSVVIQNNVAKGVTLSATGEVPRCSCEGQHNRKLVIFDLNGILADIVQGVTGQFVPDGKVSYRSVFRRPFLSSFLDFCFERFDVAIWTSRRIGLNYMISIVMRNYESNLLFCFGQNKCTTTKFKTQEKKDKPIFLKDLRKVWGQFGTCISCGKRKYNEANTLLVDDSPDKALCNPPHTAIFPPPYVYTDSQDSALGPEGELRKYLERLADAESVQKFVSENPFGQTAITETHASWEFYSKVIEAYK